MPTTRKEHVLEASMLEECSDFCLHKFALDVDQKAQQLWLSTGSTVV